MADPQLNELNTATRKRIMPTVADNFFKNGPVMRWVKEDRMTTFPGGTEIQENFIYGPMKGGAYEKGDQFDTTRRQTTTGMRFGIKKYMVNITEYMEDIEIELRTPEAVFSTVKNDLSNAALTLSAILEIAIMRHGQALAGDNRRKEFNGFEEALNDGISTSYRGNLFTSYGLQPRADVRGALTPAGGQATVASPAPIIAANVNSGMSSRVLEHSYASCKIGPEHPKVGITTTTCMAYINENYLPAQRLQDTVEPTIGWPGVKFKNATIIESNYMPGRDGINDPDLGDYSVTDTPPGETFLWLNPGGKGDDAYFRLHVSASPKFQFGFTGFKVGRDDTKVAGQILFAGNFIIRTPRLMRFLYGIKS